jgi:hypothetical protein
MKPIWIILPLVALSACSVRPDGSNGQRRDFYAPGVTYVQAYRHADAYLKQCVRGFVGISPNVTTGNLYPDSKRGELQTANGSGVIIVRMTIEAANNGSQIDIVTIKKIGLWNAKDLDAMQRAIESGTPSCG